MAAGVLSAADAGLPPSTFPVAAAPPPLPLPLRFPFFFGMALCGMRGARSSPQSAAHRRVRRSPSEFTYADTQLPWLESDAPAPSHLSRCHASQRQWRSPPADPVVFDAGAGRFVCVHCDAARLTS